MSTLLSLPVKEPPVEKPAALLVIGPMLELRGAIPEELRRALMRYFTVANPLYTDAVEHGRQTRDIEEVLRFYTAAGPGGTLRLPRGATRDVQRICEACGIRLAWEDHTQVAAPVAFSEHVTLSAVQERAVTQALARRYGVIEAPPGAGKTIMGLVTIARRGQPAVWVTHMTLVFAHSMAARERLW